MPTMRLPTTARARTSDGRPARAPIHSTAKHADGVELVVGGAKPATGKLMGIAELRARDGEVTSALSLSSDMSRFAKPLIRGAVSKFTSELSNPDQKGFVGNVLGDERLQPRGVLIEPEERNRVLDTFGYRPYLYRMDATTMYAFLATQDYPPAQIQKMIALELQGATPASVSAASQASEDRTAHLNKVLNAYKSYDGSKTDAVLAEIEQAKSVARVAITKVLERADKLEALEDKAQALADNSGMFQKKARKIRRRMWWRKWCCCG